VIKLERDYLIMTELIKFFRFGGGWDCGCERMGSILRLGGQILVSLFVNTLASLCWVSIRNKQELFNYIDSKMSNTHSYTIKPLFDASRTVHNRKYTTGVKRY